MGMISLQKGDIKKYLEYETEAYRLALETNDAMGLYQVGKVLGDTLCRMGNKKEGLKILMTCIQIGRQANFPDVHEVEERLKKYGHS
jgi:hypothetical protein